MVLKGQTRSLSHEQINPILPYSLPQLRAFLGVTGFCRIWIPRYAALARPLYHLLKDAQRGSQSLLEWDPENINAFQALKWSLQTALALGLPTQDHFQLYVYEKRGAILGVLTQL
jgi:hypothetical protein